ncbi:MAG: high-potential iron-sulfur protein [Thiohalorhabdus sp.]|uniref:high-potential iron-sulfur protein n=1 Tax=Thiohalorhabdus sp. TaxID=3094134 RepID=UPI0039809659
MSESKLSRRHFLRNAVLTVAALPATAALVNRQAWAADRVDPEGSQAKSLHYKHDVEDVDHEKYEEGQLCKNCQFYQAGEDDEWGPCTIFGGDEVNANGWCTSYAPKG